MHGIDAFPQTCFNSWNWHIIPQTASAPDQCFPQHSLQCIGLMLYLPDYLQMGLTLFPPTRQGADAVSPQKQGWLCFPQTRGWGCIPQTVFSTWGWRFIPKHFVYRVNALFIPYSLIMRLIHLQLANPKEIAKCIFLKVILYLIMKLHILSNLHYFVLSINCS